MKNPVVEGTSATTDCRDAQAGHHDPERGEERAGCTGPGHSEDCLCVSRVAVQNAQPDRTGGRSPSASAAGDDTTEARACSHVMTKYSECWCESRRRDVHIESSTRWSSRCESKRWRTRLRQVLHAESLDRRSVHQNLSAAVYEAQLRHREHDNSQRRSQRGCDSVQQPASVQDPGGTCSTESKRRHRGL